MSTVFKVNFEPRTSTLNQLVRDYPLADPTLANPLNSVCFVDGEWFVVVNKKAQRAADITVLGTAGAGGRATIPSFPLWAERGRTDVQAMAGAKVPLVRGSDWEADVRIFDAAVTVAAGAPITFDEQPLKVATIAIGGRNYCGLVGHGGSSDPAPISAYVMILPAANNGKLRIRSGWRA